MKSIKKEALKKTVVAVDKIKECNDKIVELKRKKAEIYIYKGFELVRLLEFQVKKDIEKNVSARHKLILLSIKQMILSIRMENQSIFSVNSDTCQFAKLIKKLIKTFNDINKVPCDFMTEHKEIYTIYTCMVNLELEFRKE